MTKFDIPIETLISELHGEDWKKRCDAARLLGQSRDPRAVEALLPDLQDEDWRVRRNAAQALGALKNERALEPLILALKDRVATVRERAAVALGRIKDPQAIPALLEALFEQKKSHVHINEGAYQAIRKFGRKAGPDLAKLLQVNPNIYLIDLLAEAKYEKMEEVLLPLMKHTNPTIRQKALSVLARSGNPQATQNLLDLVDNGDLISQIYAIELLGQMRVSESLAKLIPLLQGEDLFGPNTHTYRAVTNAIQEISEVKKDLADAFPFQSGMTFGTLGGAVNMPEMMGLLSSDHFQKLNKMLSNLESGVGMLNKIFNMPKEATQAASDQTWKFGSMLADARDAKVEQVKVLITLLKSELPLKRTAAAVSLPWYMDEQALEPLEKATEDSDNMVQYVAKWAYTALKTALGYRRQLNDL